MRRRRNSWNESDPFPMALFMPSMERYLSVSDVIYSIDLFHARARRRSAPTSKACRCRKSTGKRVGGEVTLKCISFAPCWRSMVMIFLPVVALTIESSITTILLPLHRVVVRVQLELYAEMADRFLRLDERPAHVMVPDQAHLEGDARGLGIADGGAYAGVGYGDDHVCLDAALPGKLPAEGLSARCIRSCRISGCRAGRNRYIRRCSGAAPPS